MTYDDISQDVRLNDQPAPPEAVEAALKIKGKTLSMTIDANGEMLDVTPPPDFPLPPALLKDMLKQALGLMPKQELAVGQSVTAPFAMAMPLPMPGDPPQLKGDLKSTLTGVTGAAGQRDRGARADRRGRRRRDRPRPGRQRRHRHQAAGQGRRHDRLGRQGRPGQGQQDDHHDLGDVHASPAPARWR